jgi:tetratricopeptide (TPR) repeat protein
MFRAEKKYIKIIICCFFIGSNYFYCQNQKKIDSLKIALKNAKHDTTRAIINLDLGELIYQQQPDSAILLWDKSKTISEKNLKKYSPKQQEYKTFLNILGYSYNDLGFIFGNRGDVVKSLEYHKKSLKIQEEIGDKNAIALSYNNIGLIYGGQSDYDNALIFFEKSLKIREEIGNKSGIAVSLNSIGNMHARQGSMEKALSYFNRSLKICQEINDNSGIAESLSNIGNMYINYGDRQKALDIFFKSLEIFEKLKNKERIANMLNSIGATYFELGNQEKALEFLIKSLKIKEELKFKKGITTALNNIAKIYSQLGNNIKAMDYYQRSLKLNQEIGDKDGVAISLNQIGVIYRSQGNIQKALEFLSKSLKIREEINDKEGIATTLGNIALIYEDQGDIILALKYHSKSLKMREEMGDKKNIALSLNNIGYIYRNVGDPYIKTSKEESIKAGIPIALDYFYKSLKIREEIGDKFGIAQSLSNIGYMNYVKGNIAEAIDYHSRSLKIRESIVDKKGMATSLNYLGAIYLKQKEYQKALGYCLKSMTLCKELGYPESIKNTSEKLKIIYKSIGNYKLAFENLELYIKMRDSLNNIETQKATITQQTKYEYDKQKIIEDEKHAAELKIQSEKAQADKKRQNIIITAVSIVMLLVAFFSVILYNRFKTTHKQKLIIEKKEKETQVQKHIIEEKQKEIVDSINYAKRIQYTLLAHEEFLKDNLNEHFIYFNPKDIVSGDFYWATKHHNKFYLAVCDSTGHGVPGAFMSLLNIGFLSEAINEKGIEKPNDVFDFVRMKLTDTISKEGQKDGFDGILVCFDSETKQITYAAANNAPLLISKKQDNVELDVPAYNIVQLPTDRMPVGIGERKQSFSLHTINCKPGDLLYLYTDGYPDQFGGPKGKKFMYKQLNELLLANHSKNINEQKTELENAFNNWKGNLEQIDDVCVIGIRI